MCLGPGLTGGLIMLILVIAAVSFIVMSLTKLGKMKMDETPRVLWTILILILPIVGSAAFFLVRPGGGE